MYSDSPRSIKKTLALIIGGIMAFVLISMSGSILENVDAGEVVVIQSPLSGELTVITTPGLKWQGFGKVTTYKRRSQYWFSAAKDEGEKFDQSIKVRFLDGGHAQLSGSIAWEFPTDREHVLRVHQKYGVQSAVEQQLIRTVVEKSVYMTGPLMTSRESYAEKRNDLISLIEDQIAKGVYRTQTVQTVDVDPISGKSKSVNVLKIVEASGQRARQEASPLIEFGVRTFNVSLNSIVYDKTVEDQIATQQKAVMDVQTAIAQSRKAEQDALTAAKNGEAEAAKAKWAQEVIKAKEVTAAQQKLEVATLDAQSMEQYKRAQTLRGEGDAAYKRLVMQADGALAQKLDAYVKVNSLYADAIKSHQGAWVPSVVMGGQQGSANGSSAFNLVDMLAVKAAKDLALDMQVPKQQ